MKNIDDIFREGLSNLEIQPSDGGMKKVLSAVSGNRSRKGFWFWMLPVAAVLALLTGLGIVFSHTRSANGGSEQKSVARSKDQARPSTGSAQEFPNGTASSGIRKQSEINLPVEETGSDNAVSGNRVRRAIAASTGKSVQRIAEPRTAEPRVPATATVTGEDRVAELLDLRIVRSIRLFDHLWNPEILSAHFRNPNGSLKFRTLYIDYLLSPDKTARFFSGQNTLYAYSRQNTETNKGGFSGTVRLTLPLEKGWFVQGGLGFTRFTDEFREEKTFDQYNQQVDTSWVIIRIPGEPDRTVMQLDTTTTHTSGKVVNRHLNKYRVINIPLQAGYRVNMGRFDWVSSTGVSMQWFKPTEGYILDENTGDMISITGDNSPYRKGPLVAMQVSTGVHYNFLSNFVLIMEPYAQTTVRSLTRQSYALREGNIHLGINTGIRFRIK